MKNEARPIKVVNSFFQKNMRYFISSDFVLKKG